MTTTPRRQIEMITSSGATAFASTSRTPTLFDLPWEPRKSVSGIEEAGGGGGRGWAEEAGERVVVVLGCGWGKAEEGEGREGREGGRTGGWSEKIAVV